MCEPEQNLYYVTIPLRLFINFQKKTNNNSFLSKLDTARLYKNKIQKFEKIIFKNLFEFLPRISLNLGGINKWVCCGRLSMLNINARIYHFRNSLVFNSIPLYNSHLSIYFIYVLWHVRPYARYDLTSATAVFIFLFFARSITL